MKPIYLLFASIIVLILGLSACGGTTPQERQIQAAREADRIWRAHDFAKSCKKLVKPGMTVREVIQAWGAPSARSVDVHKVMTWVFEVQNIMYYRGWEYDDGVKGHGAMVVHFKHDKVLQILERY